MRLASTLATHELSRMQGVCEFSRLSPTVRAGILPQLMLGALSFSLRTLVLLLALASPSIAEAQFSDVELKLLRYGAGNVARVGDPVGLLVEVKNSLDEPTEVELVWETRNADGDIEEQSRNFVLNPGQPIERWVYGTTPIARNISDASSVITTLRVFSLKGGRRETELASLPISAESAETPGLGRSGSMRTRPTTTDATHLHTTRWRSSRVSAQSMIYPTAGTDSLHSMHSFGVTRLLHQRD